MRDGGVLTNLDIELRLKLHKRFTRKAIDLCYDLRHKTLRGDNHHLHYLILLIKWQVTEKKLRIQVQVFQSL